MCILLDSASSTLWDRYVSSRSVAEGDWPIYQPKHYASLALIHHKDQYTSRSLISITKEHGNLLSKQHEDNSNLSQQSNDHHTTQQHGIAVKNLHELFASLVTKGYSLVLIEGTPGMTILSKEIAYQWATNNLLQYKRFLFLVYLRNVNSSKLNSVESLVHHVLQGRTSAADLEQYLIQSNGQDLVVVLDGYDELSETDRKSSFIADLIWRRVLSKCLLIITSHPTASLPLRDVEHCKVRRGSRLY